MKLLKTSITKLFFLSIAFGVMLSSCGGSKTNENADTTKATDTTQKANTSENTNEGESSGSSDDISSDTETTMCFEAKGLTIVSTNFRINGDQVTGTHYVRTPKAGMELYANYNLKGTKKGNNIDVDMTLIASNNMFGIGETSKMSWVIQGGKLVNPKRPDDLGGTQEKIACAEGTLFELKPEKTSGEDPFSGKYNLSGTINGNLKIKMFIETSKGSEPGYTAYNGWYYYVSQGPDKKIELKGEIPGAGIMDGEVKEFTNGNHTGSFMIPAATDLKDGLDCQWTDVAKKKALEVSLKVDK